MKDYLQVLMAAAECRDLAKVGGLGDVVRDLSKAVRAKGVRVGIVMPFYSQIRHPSEPIGALRVAFGKREDWPVEVCRTELDDVPVYLLRNEAFFGGTYGDIYIDSDRLGRGPFEDDAQRFAFFSAAALELMQIRPELARLQALHAHDWHTGVMLLLLRRDPRRRALDGRLRTLFTIHNLDYQGVRPFRSSGITEFASFSDWFPMLYESLQANDGFAAVRDPQAEVPCFNAMRTGINLADRVNTVSPNYAGEITRPDDPARNFVGGRGLEPDLAALGSRLSGILNGLDYSLYDPAQLNPPFEADADGWARAREDHKLFLLLGLKGQLQQLARRGEKKFKNADDVLSKLVGFRPRDWQDKLLVVAVTRAVRQKVSILLELLADHLTVLGALLQRDLCLILLGTGELEEELEIINTFHNGLYIAAFDPTLANALYVGGDLFLMPSDFEPCGISQMIAMRYGCLPLVSDVGGLSDTVQDMRTGFVFEGANREQARRGLLAALDRALELYEGRDSQWRVMQSAAMRERFRWSDAAEKYIRLYLE